MSGQSSSARGLLAREAYGMLQKIAQSHWIAALLSCIMHMHKEVRKSGKVARGSAFCPPPVKLPHDLWCFIPSIGADVKDVQLGIDSSGKQQAVCVCVCVCVSQATLEIVRASAAHHEFEGAVPQTTP
eukprot:171234-Pelagomonas_calceolata.AAC.1